MFFIGRSVFGHEVNTTNWEVWVGAIMTIGGGIWSWIDKTLAEDQKLSLIRTIMASAGAVVIASGKVDEVTWTNITGLVVVLMTFILGRVIKTKDANIASGDIPVSALKK